MRFNMKTFNHLPDKSIHACTVLSSTFKSEVLEAFTKRIAMDDV